MARTTLKLLSVSTTATISLAVLPIALAYGLWARCRHHPPTVPHPDNVVYFDDFVMERHA
jgi:hypothetical protein